MKKPAAVNPAWAADLSDTEVFPVVEPDGTVTGHATRRECHSGSRLLHPVVHLHVFNPAGSLYLQKRSMGKFIQPGKWDTSVGGHMAYGETPLEALRREAREEIGFTGFDARQVAQYVFDSRQERELVYTYVCITRFTAFTRDPIEIDESRFWTPQEINKSLGNNVFTPNFEQEWLTLLQNLSL